jgi:hypothetical protein
VPVLGITATTAVTMADPDTATTAPVTVIGLVMATGPDIVTGALPLPARWVAATMAVTEQVPLLTATASVRSMAAGEGFTGVATDKRFSTSATVESV